MLFACIAGSAASPTCMSCLLSLLSSDGGVCLCPGLPRVGHGCCYCIILYVNLC